jgi:hypothetical protein
MIDWSQINCAFAVSVLAFLLSFAVALDNFIPQLIIGLRQLSFTIDPKLAHLEIELWNASPKASITDIVGSLWVANRTGGKRWKKRDDPLYFRGDLRFLGPLKDDKLCTLDLASGVEVNEFNSFVAGLFPKTLRYSPEAEGSERLISMIRVAEPKPVPLTIFIEVEYRPALPSILGWKRRSRALYKAVPESEHHQVLNWPHIKWKLERLG